MIRAVLSLLLWLGVGSANAATLVENKIVCEETITAYLKSDGVTPVLLAECTTYDSTGNIIRARRTYNVTNRLSQAQVNGLIAILQQLKNYAAQNVGLPTPTPTTTP